MSVPVQLITRKTRLRHELLSVKYDVKLRSVSQSVSRPMAPNQQSVLRICGIREQATEPGFEK